MATLAAEPEVDADAAPSEEPVACLFACDGKGRAKLPHEVPFQSRFELSSGEHVIGRADTSDVALPLPHVSARHAVVSLAEDSGIATLQDLGSTSGTVIHRHDTNKKTEVFRNATRSLGHGDVIHFGRTPMRFVWLGHDPPPLVGAEAGARTAARVEASPSSGRRRPLAASSRDGSPLAPMAVPRPAGEDEAGSVNVDSEPLDVSRASVSTGEVDRAGTEAPTMAADDMSSDEEGGEGVGGAARGGESGSSSRRTSRGGGAGNATMATIPVGGTRDDDEAVGSGDANGATLATMPAHGDAGEGGTLATMDVAAGAAGDAFNATQATLASAAEPEDKAAAAEPQAEAITGAISAASGEESPAGIPWPGYRPEEPEPETLDYGPPTAEADMATLDAGGDDGAARDDAEPGNGDAEAKTERQRGGRVSFAPSEAGSSAPVDACEPKPTLTLHPGAGGDTMAAEADAATIDPYGMATMPMEDADLTGEAAQSPDAGDTMAVPTDPAGSPDDSDDELDELEEDIVAPAAAKDGPGLDVSFAEKSGVKASLDTSAISFATDVAESTARAALARAAGVQPADPSVEAASGPVRAVAGEQDMSSESDAAGGVTLAYETESEGGNDDDDGDDDDEEKEAVSEEGASVDPATAEEARVAKPVVKQAGGKEGAAKGEEGAKEDSDAETVNGAEEKQEQEQTKEAEAGSPCPPVGRASRAKGPERAAPTRKTAAPRAAKRGRQRISSGSDAEDDEEDDDEDEDEAGSAAEPQDDGSVPDEESPLPNPAKRPRREAPAGRAASTAAITSPAAVARPRGRPTRQQSAATSQHSTASSQVAAEDDVESDAEDSVAAKRPRRQASRARKSSSATVPAAAAPATRTRSSRSTRASRASSSAAAKAEEEDEENADDNGDDDDDEKTSHGEALSTKDDGDLSDSDVDVKPEAAPKPVAPSRSRKRPRAAAKPSKPKAAPRKRATRAASVASDAAPAAAAAASAAADPGAAAGTGKPHVVFTGIEPSKKLLAQVEAIGGTVGDDVEDGSFVVLMSGPIKRTAKFLAAMSKGYPVSEEWLAASAKAGVPAPPADHWVRHGPSEKKYKFNVPESMGRREARAGEPLFAGMNFVLLPRNPMPAADFKSVVESAGGTVLPKLPRAPVAGLVVVGTEGDVAKGKQARFTKLGTGVFLLDALLRSVCRQEHCF